MGQTINDFVPNRLAKSYTFRRKSISYFINIIYQNRLLFPERNDKGALGFGVRCKGTE